MLLTVHFHFTEVMPGDIRIPLRIRSMSPVVVVTKNKFCKGKGGGGGVLRNL